jgi:acetoin utilization deacetylase AcuC-like enzyme
MHAYYADQFVLPLPEGHRFPMPKYRMLRDWLSANLPQVQLQIAPATSDGELALVHTPAYVRGISLGAELGGLDPKIMREIGFPWSEAMAERARRSVGASVAAARAALGWLSAASRDASRDASAHGIAANLAGGTHHSYADKGGGFCVFNDFAVTARLMQSEWTRRHGSSRPLRVAIIDLDVHQGNGTARIFQGDESVFTLSMHGAKNFPFRKEASDLDVDLPDGCGDDEYLHALDHALDELERRFFSPYAPGLILYLAGADPHEGDRLGRLKLTYDGLEARDRCVMDWAWQRRIPMAFAMGGGYGHDLQTTLRVQQNTYRVGAHYWRRWNGVHDML